MNSVSREVYGRDFEEIKAKQRIKEIDENILNGEDLVSATAWTPTDDDDVELEDLATLNEVDEDDEDILDEIDETHFGKISFGYHKVRLYEISKAIVNDDGSSYRIAKFIEPKTQIIFDAFISDTSINKDTFELEKKHSSLMKTFKEISQNNNGLLASKGKTPNELFDVLKHNQFDVWCFTRDVKKPLVYFNEYKFNSYVRFVENQVHNNIDKNPRKAQPTYGVKVKTEVVAYHTDSDECPF